MQKPKRKTKRRQAESADKNFATLLVPEGVRLVGALKVRDAADYLDLSRITLMRLVERGLIRPNRATRHLLFSVEELQRFLREGQAE